MNTYRALALLASHPGARADAGAGLAAGDRRHLEAALLEAMRLWPTTRLLGRETLEDTRWSGVAVPAGTQVVISNTFNHRDEATHRYANRFAPEVWIDGDARHDWTLNHLSNGPQRCAGADLALFLGSHILAMVLADHQPRLHGFRLDPDRPLPHMLDFFRLAFDLTGPSARANGRRASSPGWPP
jgi:cytochrome P450